VSRFKLNDVLDVCDKVRQAGPDRWSALCPAHDDHNPSLSITRGDRGTATVFCHAGCPYEEIAKALESRGCVAGNGQSTKAEKQVVGTYDYTDADGRLVFQVVRFEPKDFRQRRPDKRNGYGPWLWNLDGVTRTLYRLPELLAADPARWVLVAEGEKDVHTLHSLGFIATTNSGGAGKFHLTDDSPLHGRKVAIIGDNDATGRRHVQAVAKALHEKAASLKVIDLPGLAEGGDVSDFLAEHTGDELKKLITVAAEFEPSEEPTDEVSLCDFAMTDAGNAELFAHMNRDRLRYDHRRGRWLIWRGHSWQTDTGGELQRLALEAMRARHHAAVDLDGDDRKAQLKWATQSESKFRIDAALSLARSVLPISDTGDGWDVDPWLVGVANGVVDLRTGELRPGKPSDRISLALPWRYDPKANAPRWRRFIREIFGGDDALCSFVQRSCGYSLTGSTREQVLFLCYGTGANGKSVFLRTLATVFGPLAINSAFSTFEQQARRSSISNDVAALDGKRLVTASETAENTRLNEARLKALTGGDKVTARFLYCEPFEFVPVGHIWLAANHKPRVADDSEGFWRRVRLIPFLQQFKGEKADQQLADKLAGEAAGILTWLVEGAVAWYADGLQPPEPVTSATAEYRAESDPLAEFLADRCELGENFEATPSELYAAYVDWAGEQHLREREQLHRTNFGRRLGERFTRRRSGGAGRLYVGLRPKGAAT